MNFGAVLKEGLYEDYGRRETLLGLARFKTTTSGTEWRSLKDYVAAIKENQTAIYYATGPDLDRLASSPQLEGFRARGIEVLLLTDQVDSFWVTADWTSKEALQVRDAGLGRSRAHTFDRRRCAGRLHVR
jgi:molecular chaperone HtpG